MNEHALTARELHSQKKGDKKSNQIDFSLTERKRDTFNRSVDDMSQEDDFGLPLNDRANVTMPDGQINDDEEVFDDNFFYGGSPNKSGLQSKRKSMLNQQAYSRQSIQMSDMNSSRPSNTIIVDKQHSELSELKQFKMQNLTSLVNNPKRDTFLNKLGSAVKNKIDSKRNPHSKQQRQIYKPLTEKEVPDNQHIPKVKKKEMQRHLQSMKVLASTYQQNRESWEKQRVVQMQREIRASKKGPFEISQNAEDLKSKKVEGSQNSNSKKNVIQEDIIVPSEFFNSQYQFDKSLLQLQCADDIKPHIDKYQKYLDNINADLEIKILKNFDFFNKSFHKFDEMKDDMMIVSTKSQLIRNAHKKLKYYQLCNMIKLYRLQRKRINTTRVSDVLRSLTALQQSVPVIDNLITNAQKSQSNSNSKESTQNFQLGLQLIAHANDLINTKLGGIDVTECYRNNLIRLKGQCCKKIEESCVSQVDYFLKQKIMVRNFGSKSIDNDTQMIGGIMSDILQIQSESVNSSGPNNLDFLMQQISNNWSFFDFNNVFEDSQSAESPRISANNFSQLNKIQTLTNFPILNDVFLDGNDKLQTNNTQQDFVSSISNTVGVNLDILIRDIKGKHQELLKQGNLQILEQTQVLVNELSEEAFKNRVLITQVANQQIQQHEADGNMASAPTCQRPKLILTFISKCLAHLYQPELVSSIPMSKGDMQQSLENQKKYRDKLLELLLSTYVLQALLFYQMARAFELIEIWIIDSVKQWQQRQKECQQYLLLHTRDQKQIQRKHELVLGQIVDQFTQQKQHISNLMSKQFDKSFNTIISQAMDQKAEENGNQAIVALNQGLLKFLIQHFKPTDEQQLKESKFNENQTLWSLQLKDQRNQDFFKICKVMQNIINWLQDSKQKQMNSLKQSSNNDSNQSSKISTKKAQSLSIRIQLQGLTNILQDVQKQFVTSYKEQVIEQIQSFLDVREKFARFKAIEKEDETEVIVRLLSKNFNLNNDFKLNEKQYPTDALQIPQFSQQSENDYLKDQIQQDVIKIEDEELQIRLKPQPSGGFKLIEGQIFFNKKLDEFIQIIEYQLPSQRQKKTAEFLMYALDIISFYNNNLKGQIIGTGAIKAQKIPRITVKHLGVVQNCNQIIASFILPSICKNIFEDEQRQIGTNIRKHMITRVEEVHRDLQQHMADIRAKFVEIIIFAVQNAIQDASKVDYDEKVDKGVTINPNNHIQHISDTLAQMQKVLFSNLSEEPFEIEENILSKALQKIFEMLEKLYFESLKDANTKYAKKRIKVDIKFLMINLQNEQYLKLTQLFKQQHFNLLVSMDQDDLKEKLDANQQPVTDITKIQVIDHYSKIKQSIKNILINRIGIKIDEFSQFCTFNQPERIQVERQKTQELINEPLETDQLKLEKSKTIAIPEQPIQQISQIEDKQVDKEQTESFMKTEPVEVRIESELKAEIINEQIQEMKQQIKTDQQLGVPNPEYTQSTQDGTASAAPLDIEQQEIVNDEQYVDSVNMNESDHKSIEHTTPTKENSPGKMSSLSMGKLDLDKVQSQKKLDEETQENQNENVKKGEPLVSERELEEIHQKNEEQRKQGKKQVTRNLWSARKSRPSLFEEEQKKKNETQLQADQQEEDDPFKPADDYEDTTQKDDNVFETKQEADQIEQQQIIESQNKDAELMSQEENNDHFNQHTIQTNINPQNKTKQEEQQNQNQLIGNGLIGEPSDVVPLSDNLDDSTGAQLNPYK